MLIAATRVCDEDLILVLDYYEGLHYAQQCFDQVEKDLRMKMVSLLTAGGQIDESYIHHVLLALALLNEHAPTHFSTALDLSDETVPHTLLLVKRLMHMGYHDESVDIINQSIAALEKQFAENRNISEHFDASKGFLGADKTKPLESYSDVISVLLDARALASHGLKLTFQEGSPDRIKFHN